MRRSISAAGERRRVAVLFAGVLPSAAAGLALALAPAAQAAPTRTDTTCTLGISLSDSSATMTYGDENADRFEVTLTQSCTAPAGAVRVQAMLPTGPVTLCAISAEEDGSASYWCSIAPDEAADLAVGSYQVDATYAGNTLAGYAPTTSNTLSVTVNQAATTTSLTLSSGSAVYGDEHTEKLSVQVSPQFTGTPTGTVTVETTGDTTLCSITLSSGSGSCIMGDQTLPASATSYQLVADYGGDANFESSATAESQFLTIGQPNVTVTLEEGGTHDIYGNTPAVQFMANLKPTSSGSPTGTVTIETTTGITVCTGTVSSEMATCSLSLTVPPGSYELVAYYSGDNNFTAGSSASSPQAFTLTQATSSVTLTASPATATYGDESAAAFTATVKPQYTGTPAGTVTITEISTSDTLCTIDLATQTSCSPGNTALAPGSGYQVIASYSGDADFAASSSSAAPQGFSVTQASTRVTLTESAATAAYGKESAEKFTAKVTPQYAAAGAPTGTVTVAEAGTTLCTIDLSSGKSCSPGNSQLGTGKYHVTASYEGDANFTGSLPSAAITLKVEDPSATSLKLSAAKVTFGHENSEHLSIRVTSPFHGAVTGRVTITAKAAAGSVNLCVITLKSGAGSCTLSARALKAGTYTLMAAYPGTTKILKSASSKRTLKVSK